MSFLLAVAQSTFVEAPIAAQAGLLPANPTSVEVVLADGTRLVPDQIGAQTGEAGLAATVQGSRIVITRMIPWNRVVSVKLGGKALSKDELIARFAQKTGQAAPGVDEPVPFGPRDRHDHRQTVARFEVPIGSVNAGVAISPVQTISVCADPISARGKVDWDSLVVELVGWDAEGSPTALRGTLQATLWGVTQRLVTLNPNEFLYDYPGRRQRIVSASPSGITRLATWTRQIESAGPLLHLADGSVAQGRVGAPVRFVLPLPRPLPDHNTGLSPFGSLHVKLAVPGHGLFETTQTGVLLQDVSPFRAYLQSQTGSRFLPQEGTSDRRRSTPIPFEPSPFSRPFSIFIPPQFTPGATSVGTFQGTTAGGVVEGDFRAVTEGRRFVNPFPTPAELAPPSPQFDTDGDPATPGTQLDVFPGFTAPNRNGR